MQIENMIERYTLDGNDIALLKMQQNVRDVIHNVSEQMNCVLQRKTEKKWDEELMKLDKENLEEAQDTLLRIEAALIKIESNENKVTNRKPSRALKGAY